jgi:hypothetical protein
MKMMEKQTLFESYRLLSVSLPKFRNSQVIRYLVEALSPTLFAESTLEKVHIAVFEQLHTLADSLITQPE